MKKLFPAVAAGQIIILLSSPAALAQDTHYMPLPVYRTGLYAASGTSYFGGVIDYFTLLNERDGGIGGVKLVWDECETGYSLIEGIKCYHSQKHGRLGKALYFDFFSEEITASLTEPGRQDRIPIISVNYGSAATGRGDIFPYRFPLGTSTYGFIDAVIRFMGHQMGGIDRLKGETIVTLYHASLQHGQVNRFMTALEGKYGFRHKSIAVAHPGNEQSSQWEQIGRIKPAYVFLRGRGLMNPVALKTAADTGYPVSRIIGSEWSNSEEDVVPAGAAADGYIAVTVPYSGTDYPLASELRQLYVHGKGNMDDINRFGSVYYNLGLWSAVMSGEAIRVAQERFGKKLSSEQVRWGFENINLSKDDLKEIGIGDIAPPIKVTCMDHTAAHAVRFHQWNAAQRKWKLITGWIKTDSAITRKLIDEDAAKYAAEHPELPQRDCSSLHDRDYSGV